MQIVLETRPGAVAITDLEEIVQKELLVSVLDPMFHIDLEPALPWSCTTSRLIPLSLSFLD